MRRRVARPLGVGSFCPMTFVRRIELLALVAIASPAAGAELRSGALVVVPAGTTVEDDLYVYGETIRIEGEVRGDVVAFGRALEVPGRVQGDLVAASRDLTATGSIGGSVRAAAARAVLAGGVGRDAVLAGSELRLNPSATIGRDLLVAGSRVEVLAPVSGTVRAAAEQLTLDSAIGGDAYVRADSLKIGESASIAGTLSYAAAQATIAPQSKIGRAEQLPAPRRRSEAAAFLVGWLRLAVGLFAFAVALRVLAPRLSGAALSTLRSRPGKSAAFGALALVAVPALALALLIAGAALGGWWLGLIALAALAIAIALAFPLVGLLPGDVLERRSARPRSFAWPLLVGALALALVLRLPILGGLAALATILFGLGALIVGGWKLRRAPA